MNSQQTNLPPHQQVFGNPHLNQNNYEQQQRQMTQGSSQTNQAPMPQMPRPPLSGIHVPEDYDQQDHSNMNNQKEKFFESLGLPPNLSDQSIKKFHQQQSNINYAPGNNDTQFISGGPIDTSMFKSAHQASGSLPGINYQGGNMMGAGGPQNFSNLKMSQQNHSSYKTAGYQGQVLSDGSFLTAFDAAQSISQHQIGGTPGAASGENQPRFVHDQSHGNSIHYIKNASVGSHQYNISNNQDPLSASAHFPSRHTDSINGVMPAASHYQFNNEERNNDYYVDSQRKNSANAGPNKDGLYIQENLNPFTNAVPNSVDSGHYHPSGKLPSQSPMTFNNTVHSIQPYTQQYHPNTTLKPLTNSQGNNDSNGKHQYSVGGEGGDQRREILTITVDIGNANGEQANIIIREGDDPFLLACEFAERHGIKSEQLRDLLAEQIQINMEGVLKEEEELAQMERQQQQIMSGVAAIQKQYGDGTASNQDNSVGQAMTSPGIEVISGVDGSYDNRLTSKIFDPYTGSSQNLLAKHSSGNLLPGTSSDQTQITHSGRIHYNQNNNQQQLMNPNSSQLNSINNNHNGLLGAGFSNQDSNSMLLLRQSAQSSNNPQMNTYGQGTGTNGLQQTTINSTVDAMYYSHLNQQQSNKENSHLNQSYNQYLQRQNNLQQQRSGSYGKFPHAINQSFVSEGSRSNVNNHHGTTFQFPGTQTYQQWKETVSAQLRSQKVNQPAINDNSRKIIEHKRLLNNSSGNASQRKKTGSVHTRLHQQAVSKQRQIIHQQFNLPPRNNGLGNTQLNVMSNGGGSTKNISRKVFNLNNSNLSSPDRNERFYSDQNFQRPQPPRSSSAQEGHQSNESSTLKPPIPTINYGERLYLKGLKRKEEQQRLLNQVRQQQEQDSLAQNCSFQPQINEISRTIAHPLRGDGVRTEEALIKFGQHAREKIEQKRSEMLFKEIAECRFRPQIAKYTERILSRQQQNQLHQNGYESDGVLQEGRYNQMNSGSRLRNSNSADKFSDLYKDAMRRRERQEKVYSACIGAECTFQPDLTVSKYYYQRLESRDPGYQQHKQQNEHSGMRHSHQPSQTRNGEGASHHYRNLSEGLNEKERLQRSLKKSSTFSNDLFDPDSGMPFFRPRVGRGPRNQHRPDSIKEKGAIAVMLYNQGKAMNEKLEFKKRVQQQEKVQGMKMVHTNDKSKYIIEEIKISHFADIFRRLDSDQDGNISCQRIDLSNIEGELLGVLEQIFAEMEELGQSLNEEEFIDATCRLYDALPLPQKRLLFNPKDHGQHRGRGSKQSTQANLYKPKLDPNSLKIMQSKRGSSNEDVTEILYRKKREYEQKILEKQQEKENLELVGCTFHPNIIQSPLSQNSAQGIKVFSRTNGGQGSTMPGSRQSFSGGQASLTASKQQTSTQPQANHSQSFHNNQSQHTATFQREGGYNNQSIGLGNPVSFGAGNFDLNTLALNVASEYLRPQQQQHQQDSFYRPQSVNGGNSLKMPPAPVPHPAQIAPLISMTLDERRRAQEGGAAAANTNHKFINLSQPVMQQQRSYQQQYNNVMQQMHQH